MANYRAKFSTFIREQKYRYDVFLSFRGEDTRYTFTGYLYNALCQRGFNIFKDDEEMARGEHISPALLKAIEESKVSIIVFSENYASSPWCLDELLKILECKKQKRQMVWPIFYKVEPSDVRHQRSSYGKAMDELENRFENEMEKVKKWKSALEEAATLSGWTFNAGYEYEFIIKIAEELFSKLHYEPLNIDEHIVGRKSHIEKVKSLLDIGSEDTIGIVGIHGIGGIGKSTLAKILYNLIVDKFDSACFLECVRERSNSCMGLVNLQEELLSHMFRRENFCLCSVDEGANMIKQRLCNKRVLLVLDDVDEEKQLRKLAGGCHWFGLGSRIIITTRDKHILSVHGVEKRFEMKELDDHEALELFCWKAFNRSQPAESYVEISNRIINYAKGLPLALNVIGSNLFGRSLQAWESALEQYERIPDKNIQGILRVSYDTLEYNQKAIFLDIACFFKEKELVYVEKILDACDLSSKFGIQVLVDKSLITVESGKLRMHDLIQDMGREVVRQDASSNLGKCSRLWNHEDILDVLTGNSGTDSIEGILFDPPYQERVEWNGAAFKKMNNLRILIVRNACFLTNPKHLPNSLRWLDWEGYPSEAFPIGFYPRNIATVKLHGSCLKLSNPFPKFEKLTLMDFSSSQLITEIPDLSGVPNIKEMNFYDCKNLIEVHDSIAFRTKLLDLNLEGCSNLKIFPHGIQMTSLKWLNLNGCTRLQKFPEILGKMDDLYIVDAKRTTFKQFPHSIGHLKGLSGLYVSDNHNLKSLPESIKQLDRLRNLDVKNCKRLRQISRIPPNLQIISADNCSSLTSQSASVIWSQVLKAIQNLVAFMPRTLIPNWFDHCCEGGVLSFWARGKLPDFVFAVVLSKSLNDISSLGSSFTIECFNNGYRTVNTSHCFPNNDGGVFIGHLHNRTINSFSVGWNYVEIRCKSQANFMIEECGVYVYKQEIKREDIRFDSPFPDHSNIMSIMSRNDRELRLSFQRRILSADELFGTPVPFVENGEQRMSLERRMDVEQLTWLREFKTLHLTSPGSSLGALPSPNMSIEIPIHPRPPMTRKKEQLSRLANQDTKIMKRSYTVYMSRKDEELDKPRKKSRIYKELEARKLKRRFIKRSPRKMIEIHAGWRRQVFPPLFFSKFFKLSSRFHAI